MSKYLIKGASLYGEKVADILIEDGVISRIAENIDAAGRTGRRGGRPGGSCPAWSTSTPTCVSPATRHPKPSRPAPAQQPWAATPQCSPWQTPCPWQTPPQSLSRLTASARNPHGAACSPSAQ